MKPDPEISGWLPDFAAADAQLERAAVALRGVVGRRLTEIWTVVVEGGEWFGDLPVVLRFDSGPQLEICWEKFDDLSITWDTIDVGIVPQAWVTWPLQWQRAADPNLWPILGGRVAKINATSFLFETGSLSVPNNKRGRWLTGGVWLATDRGDLHVFNALDENGMTTQRPVRDTTHNWRAI
ncbi:hypothetical protein [Rudaeicoccus suwonensis]|uniref:hypothetical protein n=1 Tax=Rudaeicoccus suwonensis TaxID=657409 RepID=UPI0011A1AAF8|nr:hypothetical protein [Rudaeicoccus suwonensis]